jgi:hypothetical protein
LPWCIRAVARYEVEERLGTRLAAPDNADAQATQVACLAEEIVYVELAVAKVRESLRWYPRLDPDPDHDIVGRYRGAGKVDMKYVRILDREHFLAEHDVLVLAGRPLHVVTEFLPRNRIELRVDVVI